MKNKDENTPKKADTKKYRPCKVPTLRDFVKVIWYNVLRDKRESVKIDNKKTADFIQDCVEFGDRPTLNERTTRKPYMHLCKVHSVFPYFCLFKS